MYKFLEGVRILDLSTVVLGPFVTQLLGDLGADVIKVEPPEGDVFRSVAPARNPSMGAGYLNLNRNKRSIVLDLKKKSGRDAFDRLVKTSDVFFHNMRPSAIERLRLRYEDLKETNSLLIYCAAVGFGSQGLYTDIPFSRINSLEDRFGNSCPEGIAGPSLRAARFSGHRTGATDVSWIRQDIRSGPSGRIAE